MYEKQEEIYRDIPELREVEVRRPDGHREVHSYVLRGGYLHQSDIAALKEYYPVYGIPYRDEMLDFKEVYGNGKPVVCEIGFGMGDTTARICRQRPEYNYLGIEVYICGFTRLCRMAGEEKIENLRLMRFDAVEVLRHMIPDGSLAGFHVFFPDPWPKKKHQKRRLIQIPMATLMAEKLGKGGYIYCVTDWEEYARQMLQVFSQVPGLVNPYGGWAPSRPWRPETKFERKGRAAERPIREVWVEKN